MRKILPILFMSLVSSAPAFSGTPSDGQAIYVVAETEQCQKCCREEIIKSVELLDYFEANASQVLPVKLGDSKLSVSEKIKIATKRLARFRAKEAEVLEKECLLILKEVEEGHYTFIITQDENKNIIEIRHPHLDDSLIYDPGYGDSLVVRLPSDLEIVPIAKRTKLFWHDEDNATSVMYQLSQPFWTATALDANSKAGVIIHLGLLSLAWPHEVAPDNAQWIIRQLNRYLASTRFEDKDLTLDQFTELLSYLHISFE